MFVRALSVTTPPISESMWHRIYYMWVKTLCLLMHLKPPLVPPIPKRKKPEEHFSSLSVHMLILFLCKFASPICMSKCLIFHSASILISSAAPLMGYWLLCYVPFIISFSAAPLMFSDVVLEGFRGTLGIAWMGSHQFKIDGECGGSSKKT